MSRETFGEYGLPLNVENQPGVTVASRAKIAPCKCQYGRRFPKLRAIHQRKCPEVFKER
jgi:hypothetical protein